MPSPASLHKARARLVFPLDYASLAEARSAAEKLAPYMGVMKVGLELFVRAGPEAVRMARALGCEVFLDLKLHDIPATVAAAVQAACMEQASYLTLHAAGGPAMLAAARERVEREGSALKLLAVTVLTSLDAADLAAVGVPGGPAEQALKLAALADSAGVHGMVCSVAEVSELRAALGKAPILVTPGIRPAGATTEDQKRVGTPSRALQAGATLLVVGRPIRNSPDPEGAARALLEEIAQALE